MTKGEPPESPARRGGAPVEFLRTRSSLAGRPALAEAAGRLFEYAQFLLDRDENLTKIGNLSGAARELLRRRTLELLGGAGEAPAGEGEAGPRSGAPHGGAGLCPRTPGGDAGGGA